MSNSNTVLSYWSIKNIPHEELKSERELKFKEAIDRLMTSIKGALITKKDFSVAIYPFFDEVFKLRLKALELINSQELSINNIYNELTDFFTEKSDAPDYSELIDNVLFGIRILKKVADKVIKDSSTPFDDLDMTALDKIPNLSYDAFMSIYKIALNHVPLKYKTNAINFFQSSLMLETALIAADALLNDEKHVIITEEKYIELNEVIVKNAQLYGASARGLGIIGKKNRQNKIEENNETTTEELQLAEIGMKDYLNLIANE